MSLVTSKKTGLCLDKSLFWDVKEKDIDYQKNKDFVIARVLNRGDIDDFLTIQKFYGKKAVIAAAKALSYCDRKTLNFLSLFFNIPKNNFLCFRKQSTQKLIKF